MSSGDDTLKQVASRARTRRWLIIGVVVGTIIVAIAVVLGVLLGSSVESTQANEQLGGGGTPTTKSNCAIYPPPPRKPDLAPGVGEPFIPTRSKVKPGTQLSGSPWPLVNFGSIIPNNGSAVTLNQKIPFYINQFWLRNSGGFVPPTAYYDGIVNEKYLPGYSFMLTPEESAMYYDFPADTIVRKIRMYDYEGVCDQGAMKIYFLATGSSTEDYIATFDGSMYSQWHEWDVPSGNQVMLSQLILRGAVNCQPTEIELYGDYAAYTKPTYEPYPTPTFQAQIGTNAFEWDYYDRDDRSVIGNMSGNILKIFGGVDPARNASFVNTRGRDIDVDSIGGIRHYMDWGRLQDSENKFEYGRDFYYDRIYNFSRSVGIPILACIKQTVPWLRQDGAEDAQTRRGSDYTLPSSYVDIARQHFQFAARYGRNKNIPQNLILTDASVNQFGTAGQYAVGLDWVTHMEVDNERDKNWKGRNAYQTGAEYAAQMSACYDGHKNTMGPGIGIKNADPTMLVAIAGMAGPNVAWLKDFWRWCKIHRGMNPDGTVNVPLDIVNYHQYSNDAGSAIQYGIQSRGVAPELGLLQSSAEELLMVVAQRFQGKPLWNTETGYDINQGSNQKALAIPAVKKRGHDSQADWSLRTSLLMSRWGIQKTILYMYDDAGGGPGTYASSGLVDVDIVTGDISRRVILDWYLQAGKIIGQATFLRNLNHFPEVDEYVQPDGERTFVMWVPGENGTTGNYTLQLPKWANSIVISRLIRAANDPMVETQYLTSSQTYEACLTETPIFVTSSKITPASIGFTGGPDPGPTPPFSFNRSATVQLPAAPGSGPSKKNNYVKGQGVTQTGGAVWPLTLTGTNLAGTPGVIPQQLDYWVRSNSGSAWYPTAFTDGDLTAQYFTGYISQLITPNDWYYEFPTNTILQKIDIYHAKDTSLRFNVTFWLIATGDRNDQEYQVGTWAKDHPADSWFNLTIPQHQQKLVRRLIMRQIHHYDAPAEIVLHGVADAFVKPTFTPRPKKRFNNMIGINAFEWDFYEGSNWDVVGARQAPNMRIFKGGVRHYLDWSRLEYGPQNVYTTSGAGGFRYDQIYKWCDDENIPVLVCIKTVPKWIMASYELKDVEVRPMFGNKNATLPASYIEVGQLFFQFAARYGKNPNVDRSLVSISPDPWWDDKYNFVKIGMGLIEYMEADNERDKDWKGRQCYQTGAEHAAHLSACYDGHKGALGPNVGMKTADPQMKLSTAGAARSETGWFKEIIEWSALNRGYQANGQIDLPFDIINYHQYSDNANSAQSGGTSGRAPELSGVGPNARRIVELANQRAYGMEVWITELGFDTNQGSNLRAPAIGSKTGEDVSADWTLRSSLMYSRWEVDRVMYFMWEDANVNNGGIFASMGWVNFDLFPSNGRKKHMDFMKQAQDVFGQLYLAQIVEDDVDRVYVDKYQTSQEDVNAGALRKTVFVLWVPDQKDRTAQYDLNVGVSQVRQHIPKAGQDSTQQQVIGTDSGVLHMTVYETPTFIELM